MQNKRWLIKIPQKMKKKEFYDEGRYETIITVVLPVFISCNRFNYSLF